MKQTQNGLERGDNSALFQHDLGCRFDNIFYDALYSAWKGFKVIAWISEFRSAWNGGGSGGRIRE